MTEKNYPNLDAISKPYPETEPSSQQIGKAAEGVATYAYTPLKKAACVQHQIAGVSVSDDVWRFATANDLIPHLEIAVRILFESFHEISKVRFAYEIDPEIENESWIAIRAKVDGTFEELLHDDLAYTRAIVRAVPIDKLPLIRFIPSGN
jgi:hypothetical protein